MLRLWQQHADLLLCLEHNKSCGWVRQRAPVWPLFLAGPKSDTADIS